MGADGGTIPKRCELVRSKKKAEKVNKNHKNASNYTQCQLSRQPLKKPIVACKLGRLYNKEAILEAKLSKELSQNEATKHIKSLTDVKELTLTENPAYKDEGPDKGDVYKDFNETPFLCPITSLGLNGTHTFFVNWKCGCVFSEKALNELKVDACRGCGGALDEKELVVLYPEADLLQAYKQRIADELAAKKNRKAAAKETVSATDGASTSTAAGSKPEGEKMAKKELKVGEKRKADPKSIQDDPTVSKALKSIFTTSDAAKKQPAQHWITHNPLYY
ncbi:hypothetical protein AAVH_32308 [Aphelenchoides avenae]|nr:hypothetical protein AAVH_32308 [Aphelenchus avenae]